MAEETTVLTPDGIESPGDKEKESSGKSLMVAKDLLPEKMLVIPLHDRPMFPKMMGPIIVDDAGLQRAIMKHMNQNAPCISLSSYSDQPMMVWPMPLKVERIFWSGGRRKGYTGLAF